MNPTKILMVCLGNICRSPLAQGILESKASKNIAVDSAGTAAYHIGNAPDSRSIAVAKENNIDISNLKARKFTAVDFENFDRIYVMDWSNYKNVKALASSAEHENKVQLILGDIEVPDPYYGDTEDFKHCFTLLEEACNRIVKELN
jgi:protein-tyrosine phosphatase